MLTKQSFDILRDKLPSESKVCEYLEKVFNSSTEAFSLQTLVEKVKLHFNIPENASALQLKDYGMWLNSWRYRNGTILESIVYWSIVQLYYGDGSIKEVGYHTWENLNGPDADTGTPRRKRKQMVDEIKISAKLLMSAGLKKQEIETKLLEKWSDNLDEIILAMERVKCII